MLTAFGFWMNNDALNKKIDKLYLIMSDGYLIKKLFEIIKQKIQTVAVDEIYMSRLTRSPRILLDEGITGDIKQIKYYISSSFFKEECKDEANIIIADAKNNNNISMNNIIKLNNMLDKSKLEDYSSQFD